MLDYADNSEYWEEYKRSRPMAVKMFRKKLATSAADSATPSQRCAPSTPTEHSVVDVVGYYSKDDKIAPRTYVWVEGNEDAEDFGSTIMSSLSDFSAAGRWKLCETPVLCSTTFGVFPR